MHRKSLFLLFVVVTIFIGAKEAEAKKGFYMGINAAYNSIQGDFDGRGGLQNGTEIIILPDVENGLGLDFQIGYGFTDRWAIELNLLGSGHTGTWGGVSGDLGYASLSINGKFFFTTSSRTQPYLLFGISGNSLVIKNGSEDIATGQVGDATLSGPGVNLGIGMDQYLSKHVSLTLSAMYRFITYTDAEGVNHSGSIDEAVNGSGFSFLVGTAYHF